MLAQYKTSTADTKNKRLARLAWRAAKFYLSSASTSASVSIIGNTGAIPYCQFQFKVFENFPSPLVISLVLKKKHKESHNNNVNKNVVYFFESEATQ